LPCPSEPPEEFDLEPGDRLVLYTDGLVEIFNGFDDMLGVEGLKDLVHESATLTLAEMQRAILVGFGPISVQKGFWVEVVDGLGCAFERIKELAAEKPAHYFVKSLNTHKVLASSVDSTKGTQARVACLVTHNRAQSEGRR
jgi:hypothetical protein